MTNARNRAIKTTCAAVLGLTVLCPAAASASIPPPFPSVAGPRAVVPAVVPTPSQGFDWSDAGLGAARGFGLAIIALGSGLALTQRRGHGHGHRSVAAV